MLVVDVADVYDDRILKTELDCAMPSTIVRIISLDSAVARRELFSRNSVGAEIEWSFFPACTDVEEPLVYSEAATVLKTGRPMIRPELGCYTSHYKVWEDFIATGADQVIIMEDDVVVDWVVMAQLARQDLSQFGIHILKMFATHPFPSVVASYRFLSAHSHLIRSTGQILGMQCYLLTRRGAEALLRLGQVIERPVDYLISQSWEHDLPNYCLFPFPVLERSVQTSIAAEHHEFLLSPQEKLMRLAWRSKHKVMQQIANRRHARLQTFKLLNDRGRALIN